MRITAAVLVGLVVGLGVGLVLLQDRLIYYPARDVPSPAAVGLPEAQPITVSTTDGLALDAWYVPASGDAVGAVLVLPGNAGNRAGRAPLAARLRAMGLATLLLDYRGYGGNPGRPSQDGLLADAHAGAAALAERTGLPDDRIVYFGESLGSAVAAGLAAQRPPGALVLRSPFPSLAAVGELVYPWLPVGLLLRDRYPAATWLESYAGPTLVVIGGRDRLVPPELSRRAAAAPTGPTDVRTVDGADHNAAALLDGDEMVAAIRAFLDDRAGLPVRG